MSPHPRHVLITGASRGIGLAVAQMFAKSSYRCTLISRSEEGLRKAVATLPPIKHHDERLGHAYVAGDITSSDPSFWSSTFSAQFPKPISSDIHHPSKVDVLVNCAGISQSSLFMRTSDEDIDRIIALNLTALMKGTRFLMRQGYIRDVDTPSPSIINISSLLALHSGFGTTAYSASKAGILAFTRALASEYSSHRVRINAVVPGYIETDMTSSLNAAELCARIPMGRYGTVEEVAHAVKFLAENEYANNCVVNLDGGLSAV
ncbi:NAD(P)-binding protein [Phaeosphaeriaceae sp. SRC1lsM3a]|nr:NAD(P)-binding protein [Stagonospora sp. SRC1lsM3a]